MTGRARPTGRHRAPRRHRWVWTTAAALTAGVLVALLGSGGTYALWNASASTQGATIRSGTAALSVSALSTTRTPALGPGTSTTGTFTVRNSGTVPLSIRVVTSSTEVTWGDATDADVLSSQTLHLSSVGSASSCRPGLGGARGPLASFDTGSGYYTLPVGATGTACIEVALSADAPQSVSGAVTDFTLTVSGTQVAP